MHLMADFNAIRQGNMITTSLRFAVPAYGPEPLIVGQWVRLEDEDGNSCWGVVQELSSPIVRVRLDWSTWRSADQVELSYEYRRRSAYRGYFFRHPTESRPMPLSDSLRSSHALTSSTETSRTS
jgi:hypothetical protein